MIPRLKDLDQERHHMFTASGGEVVSRQDRTLLVQLPPGRSVLSTSWLNGGYHENLEYVLNHEIYEGVPELIGVQDMPEYLSMVANSLGLRPGKVTGLVTAVPMRNAVIVRNEHSEVEVVAIVTAGVKTNGGRAGDSASYHSEIDKSQYVAGTINTILIVSAFLPPSVMARATMTATEAKTCALQQLMAPSRYSQGVATGSGTDMIAVVSDNSSRRVLLDAGKHNKLGELIGRSVIEATTQALNLQNDLTPSSQMDAMVRLERYHASVKDVWLAAEEMGFLGGREEFLTRLNLASRTPEVVSVVAALLHIQDEISWGLIPEKAGSDSARRSLDGFLSTEGQEAKSRKIWFASDQGIVCSLVRFMAAISCGQGRLVRYE